MRPFVGKLNKGTMLPITVILLWFNLGNFLNKCLIQDCHIITDDNVFADMPDSFS